jgi:hypothetical protein
MEGCLTSDYSAARGHLERAYDALKGQDETSARLRETLDLLIEAVATAEYSRPAKVVDHPAKASRR